MCAGWFARLSYDDGAITDGDLPHITQAKYRLLDQGGGKSLAAKAVAGLWGLPLLRLDFGTLYNKFFGETERNLRKSLDTAAAMAPCVLWVDEIEKAIASGDYDSGTSKRVLGTLLTWMAERDAPVFLVATANRIDQLPPELIRKGRMDEIFFVDLPETDVRLKIFDIHLNKRGLSSADFDLVALAANSRPRWTPSICSPSLARPARFLWSCLNRWIRYAAGRATAPSPQTSLRH